MPKGKGKGMPPNKCNSAILNILSYNLNQVMMNKWDSLTVELPFDPNNPNFNQQAVVSNVDLTNCTVTVTYPLQKVTRVENVDFIEANWVSYEVKGKGSNLSVNCNSICEVLFTNLSRQNINGWGTAEAFELLLNNIPYQLKEVSLTNCTVTVDKAPIMRSCQEVGNTWNSFQIHK
ncbi:hypothetical protein [Priestia megaterium]|uniref:hypothetical protein n=1 Tax=Priestia megaterium TaxID=1404 RepID=UPI003D28F1CA